MKVEKIDRVLIRVREGKKATEFFADLLGTEFTKVGELKEADIINFVDPLGIEIIEPFTPDGPVAKSIERRGEGLAGIAFEVTNLEEAVAEMKSRGIRQIGRVERGKMKSAIFHPADTYGMMIELIEYKPLHPLVGATHE